MNIALMLTGGGSRGAYQAGVLKGICEVLKPKESPFSIISGSSAGAINGAFLASTANDIVPGAEKLEQMWRNMNQDLVLDTRFSTLFRTFLNYSKRASSAISGVHINDTVGRALLDTAPLANLISQQVDFDAIQRNIDNGAIDSLVISATQYNTAYTIHFIQSRKELELWKRYRATPVVTTIGLEHILASSAIPFLFPPHLIGSEYYGDGSIRNTHPLSPSIHLGADKLCIIGVRNYDEEISFARGMQPSISRIASVMLNALFLDAVDADLQLLEIKNRICENTCQLEDRLIRPIDVLHIHPSQDISQIAYSHFQSLPTSLRRFIQSLGSPKEASALISYLFFESEFCAQLVDLGYKDALNQASEIEAFWADKP